LLAGVRTGRAHLCFLPRDSVPGRGDLATLPILRTAFGLVVSRTHRLSHQRSIRLADLANETFIRVGDRHTKDHSAYIVKMCRDAGFTPIFGDQKASSFEGLMATIGAGFGVTLLPHFVCPPSHPLVNFVPTDCPEIELCAVWLRSEESLLLRHYLDILRAQVVAAPLPG
jgi:DNA-binding transcriptional LysR family regulator